MSTTAISLSVQELSSLYTSEYCGVAVFVLLVYDWLLCLDQEIRLIWTWRSRGVTISSFVYALSRYAWLADMLLTVMTIHPMSDLSCRANIWTEIVTGSLGLIASSTFSALRAYALSNRSMWMVTIIILLALCPAMIKIVEQFYSGVVNLPSPLNCSPSSLLPPTLATSGPFIVRASQLLSELLVIGITWWYTYQSYRIRKGITLGETISSLLFYNGSMYFLCLATLYTIDIVFSIPLASISTEVQEVRTSFELFIEPITSILACRFMLSLREFDSAIANATCSGMVREHMASAVLEFGAQPSDSLPAAIASFAHPVHVDAVLSEMDPHVIIESGFEEREIDAVLPALDGPFSQGPVCYV